MAANTACTASTYRPHGLKEGIAVRGLYFATTAAELAAGTAPGLEALSTGAIQIDLQDNLAAAFLFQEAANAYLTFVTTNSSEAVKIDKTLDLNANLDMDATTATIDLSGAISIDAVGNSNLNVASGNLLIQTTTSGELDLTAAGLMDINAGANLDVDVTGTVDVLASSTFSIDGTGASNVSATSGNLTISTLTTGALILDSVALLDMNAGANLDIDVTGTVDLLASSTISIDGTGNSNLSIDTGDLTVSTTTSGSLILDGVALVDINAGANLDVDVTGNVTIDATGTFSVDGVGASNVTTDTGDLTIATTTSGDLILTSASGEITANDLIKPSAMAGADSAGALLIGVGTTGDPATTATADKNALEFRTQTTATSGDYRAIYARTDFAGAGGGGEGFRGNTVITAAADNVISGNFGTEIKAAGGSITGLAVGCRGALTMPNETQTGGTVYAGMSEIWLGGTSTVANFTKHAIHAFGVEGADASTRNAQIDTLFEVYGVTSTSGGLFYANTAAVPGNADASYRTMCPDGVVRWILLFNQEA